MKEGIKFKFSARNIRNATLHATEREDIGKYYCFLCSKCRCGY